jgi:uncharacterized membrane protein YgcG
MQNVLMVKARIALLFLGLMFVFGALLPASLRAQAQPAPAPYEPFSPEQMDSLTARVALYPDALLSEIFVAATYPLEVVEASQWLAAGNNPATVDQQPWDPSVTGLTRFPAVLNQMASDASWTNDMGAAFLNQKSEVFASVQRLRAQAIAAGTLYSTPQQQVVRDAGVIQIIPADPSTIYVPTYDPSAVYYPPQVPVGTAITPLVSFDYSAPVGPWLAFDCDWTDGDVYIGDWGVNRPWWHWRDHDWHYSDFRPGHYANTGHADWHPAVWSHDEHRRGPAFHPLPEGHPGHVPLARPEAMPEIDRGAAAIRDAERGREDRERNAPGPRIEPQPAPFRPAPEREAPPERRDVAPERREAPPEREAPPAMNYNRGEDAARASERGAESRGGGGGVSGGGGARGGGGGHR